MIIVETFVDDKLLGIKTWNGRGNLVPLGMRDLVVSRVIEGQADFIKVSRQGLDKKIDFQGTVKIRLDLKNTLLIRKKINLGLPDAVITVSKNDEFLGYWFKKLVTLWGCALLVFGVFLVMSPELHNFLVRKPEAIVPGMDAEISDLQNIDPRLIAAFGESDQVGLDVNTQSEVENSILFAKGNILPEAVNLSDKKNSDAKLVKRMPVAFSEFLKNHKSEFSRVLQKIENKPEEDLKTGIQGSIQKTASKIQSLSEEKRVKREKAIVYEIKTISLLDPKIKYTPQVVQKKITDIVIPAAPKIEIISKSDRIEQSNGGNGQTVAINAEQVGASVRAKHAEFRACHAAMVSSESTNGFIHVQIIVKASGRVAQAAIESSSFTDKKFQNCILSVFSTIHFQNRGVANGSQPDFEFIYPLVFHSLNSNISSSEDEEGNEL